MRPQLGWRVSLFRVIFLSFDLFFFLNLCPREKSCLHFNRERVVFAHRVADDVPQKMRALASSKPDRWSQQTWTMVWKIYNDMWQFVCTFTIETEWWEVCTVLNSSVQSKTANRKSSRVGLKRIITGLSLNLFLFVSFIFCSFQCF